MEKPHLKLSKLIYLSDCLADENWVKPATWNPTDIGTSQSTSGLAYFNECENAAIPLTDLSFELYDMTAVRAIALTWGTVDTTTGTVTLTPTWQEYAEYNNALMTVQVRATPSNED